MADLDLRLVRYFVAVANHRHFGRAAEELRVAQPSLSRQIRRLEQDVGALLLERTPRGTTITAAGEEFLPLALELLRAADRAGERARAAARPERLVVGYTANLIVTPIVRELGRRNPGVDVHALHVEWGDQRAALLDGRVDGVVTRMPLASSGLEITVLYDEPRVVVVPLDHRLAGKEYVTVDDIADEPLPRLAQDPVWNAFWRIDPRPDGSPAPDGPLVGAIEDKFEVIAAGLAIAIAPALREGSLRPDLTAVPLEGVEPSHVVLATRAGDRNRLVATLRKAARAHLTGP